MNNVLTFFCEDIEFKLASPQKTANWLKNTATLEKATPHCINYIFCSDSFLHSLNKKYLKHNTYTDIITFDYASSNQQKRLEGDSFISIERVQANANIFGEPFDRELHRVLVHGLLHLLGFNDKSTAELAVMRKKEKKYLDLLK